MRLPGCLMHEYDGSVPRRRKEKLGLQACRNMGESCEQVETKKLC